MTSEASMHYSCPRLRSPETVTHRARTELLTVTERKNVQTHITEQKVFVEAMEKSRRQFDMRNIALQCELEGKYREEI